MSYLVGSRDSDKLFRQHDPSFSSTQWTQIFVPVRMRNLKFEIHLSVSYFYAKTNSHNVNMKASLSLGALLHETDTTHTPCVHSKPTSPLVYSYKFLCYCLQSRCFSWKCFWTFILSLAPSLTYCNTKMSLFFSWYLLSIEFESYYYFKRYTWAMMTRYIWTV